MYELVYKQKLKSGVMEHPDQPQYEEVDGNFVDKDKSFGLPVKYKKCFLTRLTVTHAWVRMDSSFLGIQEERL